MSMKNLYEDVFKITKTFFNNIDCGNCNNTLNEFACEYCSNQHEHNLLWNVSDAHAHLFAKEIIKLVKENDTVD